MNIRMADSAELDVDMNVVFFEIAAGKFEWCKRRGGTLCSPPVGLSHYNLHNKCAAANGSRAGPNEEIVLYLFNASLGESGALQLSG
jgi:hypothetical protein